MAKNAVTDWDKVAANNTDIGGIGIQGTNLVSNFDDALRTAMSQIATFITDANFRLTSTDAGATVNPTMTLFRDSATPNVSDAIGKISFDGRDSGAAQQTYADIFVTINDPTAASEDATITIRNVVAGAMTIQGSVTATGWQIPAIGATTPGTGAFTALTASTSIKPVADDGAPLGDTTHNFSDLFLATGAVINWANSDVLLTHSANTLAWAGASSGYSFDAAVKPSANDAAALGVSGTAWSDAFFASGAVINFAASDVTITHSTGILDFSAGFYRFQSTGSATPGSGNNLSGVSIDSAGTIYSSRGGNSAIFNRTTDGNLININSGGANQGIISVAAGVVTYGAFFGSHWSQLADGSKPDILRGTIVETIDQMCAWPGEGPEERLPCFKISDTPGSRSVYGVFAWWEIWDGDGEPPTNDAFIGSLGAFVIRIAAGITVHRGDYIESNGDGCGRVQADDILRSSTVAKVTSATIVETYPDGSYLVPCTLHCG